MEAKDIRLCEFKFDDWNDVYEYTSNEKASVYQPWGPLSPEETKAYISRIIEDSQKVPRTRFVFAVRTKESDKVIGAGEISIKDTRNRRGEISYILNPGYWGNGYATRIASCLLEFGFAKLNLHSIYATCDPRNIASSKVLEKIGMKYEGRMRHVLLIRDGWRDSSIYSILESEYEL